MVGDLSLETAAIPGDCIFIHQDGLVIGEFCGTMQGRYLLIIHIYIYIHMDYIAVM